jgi:hypothetical protein
MTTIKPGIYLERKESTIGTGITTQSTEYRNLWMTLNQTEDKMQVVLLDDDFKLTGVRQAFPVSDFEEQKLTYVPEGEDKYQALLMEFVQKRKKTRPAPKPKPAAQKAEPKTGNWWESPEKEVKPGDAFKRNGEKPQPAAATPQGNWWEGPQKDIKPGDIFKRPGDPDEPPPQPVKKKKPSTATVMKKTWWDR